MTGQASDLKLWIYYTSRVMEQNLGFLLKNYRELFDESIKLLNDIMEIKSLIWPRQHLPYEVRSELLSRYLMYPMVMHVAYPQANFLPIAVLLGALPQAFYTLRTILEALVIALYADYKEDLKDKSWGEKIEHESVKKATVFAIKDSLRKLLIKALGENEGEKWAKNITDLYQAISAWVHPIARIKIDTEEELSAGILKDAIITLLEKNKLPNYSLGIPAEYDKEDLDNIKYLGRVIKQARRIFAIIVYIWSNNKEFINREPLRKFIKL